MSDNLTWIKHDGGPMPVPGDTVVAITYLDVEDGEESESGIRWKASEWDDIDAWCGERRQIEKYAIVTQSPSAGVAVKDQNDQYAAGTIDAHYRKCAIEPMTYSMANGLDAMQHTIIKYVTRFRDKNGVRDLYAARHVVDMLIGHEEGKGND